MKALAALTVLLALIGPVGAENLIQVKKIPLLYNEVFKTVDSSLQLGRMDEYQIPVQPDQTLYLRVEALSSRFRNQVFLNLPQLNSANTERTKIRYWQGKVADQELLTVQVWSEWDAPYRLAVTRK